MIDEMFTRDSSLSFEVFPPKKDDEFENCYKVLDQLATLGPDFISVTYGAGGSRSKRQWRLPLIFKILLSWMPWPI